MAHLTDQAQNLLKRVRRIGGQLKAIERALQTGQDCETTLHLVAAARGAMNGLLDEVLAAHVTEHVARGDLSANQRSKGAKALMAAIRRYTR